jgi:hypothetical protein
MEQKAQTTHLVICKINNPGRVNMHSYPYTLLGLFNQGKRNFSIPPRGA